MATNTALAADELSADEEKLLREAPDDASDAGNDGQGSGETPQTGEKNAADGAVETGAPKQGENGNSAGVAEGNKGAPDVPSAASAKNTVDGEQRTVPLASLIEERKERQRIAEQLAEYKGRTEATIRAIQERLAKPKEEPQAPTLETDPVGVLRETQEQVAAIRQRQEAEAQLNQFSGYVANQVHEFRSQTPDYDAALQHARNSRIGELKIMGLSDQQARERLALDEFAFAQSVIQAGRNVGQALYEYAGLKGYKKPEPAPAAAPATPTAEQKLETIVKGQQAAKSLGGTNGAVGAPPLNIEMLEKMSADQIGALSDDEFRRLMGG